MDADKGPLPLSYVVDGKHSEQISGRENTIKDKIKIRRSLNFGDPLPLPYVKVEDDKVIDEHIEVQEVERKPRLKLEDLGDPLPLEYRSNDVTLEEEAENVNHSDVNNDTIIVVEKPKRINKIYDFGTPLPLEYLQRKSLDKNIYEKKDDGDDENDNAEDDSHNNNEKNINFEFPTNDVINHNLKNDIKRKASFDEQVAQITDGIPDSTLPSNEMNLFQDITKYVEAQDTFKLQKEMKNADFRLQLMRYTRQLKKQYEYLSNVLNIKDDVDDVKQPELPIKVWSSLLHPLAVTIMVIITLCTLSYFLAD